MSGRLPFVKTRADSLSGQKILLDPSINGTCNDWKEWKDRLPHASRRRMSRP